MSNALTFNTKCLAATLLLSLSLPLYGQAATYYVDFQAGNDVKDGLSQASAWKRAPGDPVATGSARSVQLRPRDTVLFKGGVVYNGNITVQASGVSGSPITYKGNGWGTGKAIVDGSTPWRPIWTRCSSAAECAGNPQFATIYYASAPSGYTDFQQAIFENGDFLWYSQSPNPSDPFYHDNIEEMTLVPRGSMTQVQTRTAHRDTIFFTQTDPSFWRGAYIYAWVTGNVTRLGPITSFNPGNATVTHADLGSDPYTDRPGRYAVLNHPSLIDRPGEFAYVPTENRIYLWPRSSGPIASNNYAVGNHITAFYIGARQYVTIEGFAIRHYAFGIQNDNSSAAGLVFRKNEVSKFRSGEKYAIQMSATNSLVEGNRITDCNRAVGILAGGNGITIKGNYVKRTSRQGIWFMGAKNSRIVWNTVEDIRGAHANGISIYSSSSNVLVAHNIVRRTNSPLTYEASSNITFFGNLIDSEGGGFTANDWFGTSGTIAFVNNTFARNGQHAAIKSNGSAARYVIIGNILDGGGAGTHDYNLYTGLASWQTSQNRWSLAAHERVETDLGRSFVAPGSADFRLLPSSTAVNRGLNPAPYLPISTFPDYDFNVDLAGNRRPSDGAWDIGAYEFVAGARTKPVTSSNRQRVP